MWIQADGHVVLGDFSYAKELPPRTTERVRTYTSYGSREYQSPEMILGWGYDFAVRVEVVDRVGRNVRFVDALGELGLKAPAYQELDGEEWRNYGK